MKNRITPQPTVISLGIHEQPAQPSSASKKSTSRIISGNSQCSPNLPGPRRGSEYQLRLAERMTKVCFETVTTAAIAKIGQDRISSGSSAGGYFQISNVRNQYGPALASHPRCIFPYRRTVSILLRAGFHAIILNPGKFQVLYYQGRSRLRRGATAKYLRGNGQRSRIEK
jgi:hypothetical protein